MSSSSSLVTAELTIDLEQDDVDQPLTPTSQSSQKFISRVEFKPITLDNIQFHIADKTVIGNLLPEAQDVLVEHLDIEQVGTMQNWEAISSELGLSGDNILNFMNDGKTRRMLWKCSHIPLNKLIKALAMHKRIDTLYSLHILNCEGRLANEKSVKIVSPTFSNQSTRVFRTGTHSSGSIHNKNNAIKTEQNGILVVSFCKSKEEKKEVKWLMRHFEEEKYNKNKKQIYYLEKVSADYNVEQSVKDAFERAEHIVFCMTPSLVDLKNERDANTDFSARCVNHIMRLADQEFWSNQHKNYRFRPVIFETFDVTISSIGWATATLQYKFPTMAHGLFQKLDLM